MPTLVSALMALGGPLARKVLASLGIGFLAFQGVDAAVMAALGSIKSNFAGIAADAAAIIAISGLNTAFGIIAGAYSGGLSMMVFTRMAKIA